MKENVFNIPPELNLPLRRRRSSQNLSTVVSLRVSDDELLLLRWLEAKTRRTASDILRDAFSSVLQRKAET